MKTVLLAFGLVAPCFACHAQEKDGVTLDEFSKQRGPPLFVVPAYRFVDGKLPTVSFYELDRSPLAALSLRRDRYLIYASDEDFASDVAVHFKSMLDPKMWTGSTMFAARWTAFFGASAPTVELEIVHFNPAGRPVGIRRVNIHIAYFEAGAEGREIRKPTTRKKPNKAPEPTPGAVTPRATEGASR